MQKITNYSILKRGSTPISTNLLGVQNYTKLHKITHNSMKNKGSTPIITNLVGVYPRNNHTKFDANPCSGLREVKHVFNEDS